MRLTLNDVEARKIVELASGLAARYGSAEDPEFVASASVYAHDLPVRLRMALNHFRLFEPPAAILRVAGYPIRDQEIGPTPSHWKVRQQSCVPVKEEIVLMLMGALLGDAIAWATQQDGALVHDIAPIKAHETEQLGSGSTLELTWHTEDAFHPFRGDYIAMMCLRNPDLVPTTVSALDVSELDDETLGILFEPHFTIRPDESHLARNRVVPITGEDLQGAQDRIDQMNARPAPVPVLFGSRARPYCRLDPYFMDPPDHPAAREALKRLIDLLDSRLEEMTLEAGEVCFIDNFKAVHGRRPYKPRYDGTDRWLKRLNITRNLRHSRASRPSPESRVLM